MRTGRPRGRPRKSAPKPVTIIKCGECKHFNKPTCPMVVSLPIKSEQKTSGWVDTFRNTADDYCSRAERKEE